MTLGRLPQRRAGRGRRCGALGFGELRVRHYGDLARIEVPLDRLADVVAAAPRPWWRPCRRPATATSPLDLEGLRSGNLNAALRPTGGPGASPVTAAARRVGAGSRWGRPRASTPSRSTIRPLAASSLTQRRAVAVVAHHHGVLGHREQQRAGLGVGVARAQQGVDLQRGPARVRGVDAGAVVHDAFEDRQRTDPHGSDVYPPGGRSPTDAPGDIGPEVGRSSPWGHADAHPHAGRPGRRRGARPLRRRSTRRWLWPSRGGSSGRSPGCWPTRASS